MSQSPPTSLRRIKPDPALVPVRTRYYRKDFSEVTGWRPTPRPHSEQQVQPTITKPLAAHSRREINQFPRYPKAKVFSLLSVSARGSPVRTEALLEQLKGREVRLDADTPKQEAKVYLPVCRVPPTLHSAGHSHSKSDLRDNVLHIPSQSPTPAVAQQTPLPKSQSSENIEAQVSLSSFLPFSIPGALHSLQLDLRPLQRAALPNATESTEAGKAMRQSSPSAETSAGPETMGQGYGKEVAQGTETERFSEENRGKGTASAERAQRPEYDKRKSLVTKVFEGRSLLRSQSVVYMPQRTDNKEKFGTFLKGLISGNTDSKGEAVNYVKQELKAAFLSPPSPTHIRRQSFDVSPHPDSQFPHFPTAEIAVSEAVSQEIEESKADLKEITRPETQGLPSGHPLFQQLIPIEATEDDTEEPEIPVDIYDSVQNMEIMPGRRELGAEEASMPIHSDEQGTPQQHRKSFYLPQMKEEEVANVSLSHTAVSAAISPPPILLDRQSSPSPSPPPIQKPAQLPVPSHPVIPQIQRTQTKLKRPQRRSVIAQPSAPPAVKPPPRRSLLVRTRKPRREIGSPPPIPPPLDPSPPSADSLQTDKDSEPEEPLPARDPMFRRGERRKSTLIQTDLQQNLTRLFTRRRASLSGEVRALWGEPEDVQKLIKELPIVNPVETIDAVEDFVLNFAKSLLVSLQQMDLGPEDSPKVPITSTETSRITPEIPQIITPQLALNSEEEEKQPSFRPKPATDTLQVKGLVQQSIDRRRASRMPAASRSSLKSSQDSRAPPVIISPPLTPSKGSIPSHPSDQSLAATPRNLGSRKASKLISALVPRRSLLPRASILSKRPKPANSSSSSEEAEEETPGSAEEQSPARNYLAGSADFELKHMEMVKKMAEELLVGNGRKRRARFFNIALDEAELKQKEAEDGVTSEEETPMARTPCITYDVRWQKEAEENDLQEDVAEKLVTLMQGKPDTLHDFAFSAKINFDFQTPAEISKGRTIQNYEATDNKPDEAGLASEMLRQQFYERCKAKVRLEESSNRLEVFDSSVPSRAEKYAVFRKDLAKRIKKEKTLRSRSGQEMVKLHAKPLASFTNLPLPLSTAPKHLRTSLSDQLLLDGKANQVQSPRELQERVYLRIKGERDLQRLSRREKYRPYHFKSVSQTVAQLAEIGDRPGSVQ